MKDYKFNGSTYLTRGVSQLDSRLIFFLWQILEDRKQDASFVLDYLQVFSIKQDGDNVRIIHSQELPEEYEKEYVLENVSVEKSIKIFVIDDVDHVTTLLSSEY